MVLKNKSGLISRHDLSVDLASRSLLTQAESADVITELFKIIKEKIADRKNVSITNFGRFNSYYCKSRVVYNPVTQEPSTI